MITKNKGAVKKQVNIFSQPYFYQYIIKKA